MGMDLQLSAHHNSSTWDFIADDRANRTLFSTLLYGDAESLGQTSHLIHQLGELGR